MRTRIIGLIILVLVGTLISECSSANRDDSGKINKSGDLNVTETRVGDCFTDFPNVTDASVDVASVKAIPCSEPHSWQIFHKTNVSLNEYTEESVKNESDDICGFASDALFASMSYSKLNEYQSADINIIQPTYQGWLEGYKSVDCLIGSDTQIFYTSVLD